eukprot:jgi/Mesvir1/19878/Mv13164-RA.1
METLGTRLYVYMWRRATEPGGLPDIVELSQGATLGPSRGRAYRRMETEPALHTFLNDRQGMVNALQPLLDFAMAQVPKNKHAETKVFLFGTAGMRRLPLEQAESVLNMARSILHRSPFQFLPEYARTISGKAEAVYGWLSLNYVKMQLQHHHEWLTLGALDLGGSSLEVSFVPTRPPPQDIRVVVTAAGVTYSLFVQSHGGYGLNEAFDASVALLLRDAPPALHPPPSAAHGAGHRHAEPLGEGSASHTRQPPRLSRLEDGGAEGVSGMEAGQGRQQGAQGEPETRAITDPHALSLGGEGVRASGDGQGGIWPLAEPAWPEQQPPHQGQQPHRQQQLEHKLEALMLRLPHEGGGAAQEQGGGATSVAGGGGAASARRDAAGGHASSGSSQGGGVPEVGRGGRQEGLMRGHASNERVGVSHVLEASGTAGSGGGAAVLANGGARDEASSDRASQLTGRDGDNVLDGVESTLAVDRGAASATLHGALHGVGGALDVPSGQGADGSGLANDRVPDDSAARGKGAAGGEGPLLADTSRSLDGGDQGGARGGGGDGADGSSRGDAATSRAPAGTQGTFASHSGGDGGLRRRRGLLAAAVDAVNGWLLPYAPSDTPLAATAAVLRPLMSSTQLRLLSALTPHKSARLSSLMSSQVADRVARSMTPHDDEGADWEGWEGWEGKLLGRDAGLPLDLLPMDRKASAHPGHHSGARRRLLGEPRAVTATTTTAHEENERLGGRERVEGGAHAHGGTLEEDSSLPVVYHPCIQRGYRKEYVLINPPAHYGVMGRPEDGGRGEASGGANVSAVLLVGDADWSRCWQLASRVVHRADARGCSRPPCVLGHYQPAARGTYVALTGFFVVYDFFNIPNTEGLDMLLEKGRQFCQRAWADVDEKMGYIKNTDRYCFRAPYLVLLLREGLRLLDSQVQIGSGDVGWTLGSALYEGGALHEATGTGLYFPSEYPDSLTGAWALDMGILAVLIFLFVAFARVLGWRRGDRSTRTPSTSLSLSPAASDSERDNAPGRFALSPVAAEGSRGGGGGAGAWGSSGASGGFYAGWAGGATRIAISSDPINGAGGQPQMTQAPAYGMEGMGRNGAAACTVASTPSGSLKLVGLAGSKAPLMRRNQSRDDLEKAGSAPQWEMSAAGGDSA